MGVDPTAAMLVYVMALIAVALGWSARLLRRSDLLAPRPAVLLAALTAALVVVPLTDFAQREHLFLILIAPWLILTIVRPDAVRRAERAGIGVYAALGVALKPVFVVVPAALVILDCLRARSVRPLLLIQNVAMAGSCILYPVGVLVWHPAFFTEIVPDAFAIYGAYSRPVGQVLARVAMPIVILAVAAAMAGGLSGRDRRIAIGWLTGAVAGLLIFAWQSKGWSYQAAPFFITSLVACFWIAAALMLGGHRVRALLVVASASIAFAYPAIRVGPYQNGLAHAVAGHFTCPAGQRSFQVLGTNVSASYPLANLAGARPANRTPALWTVPGAVRRLAGMEPGDLHRAAMTAILDQARERIVADFLRVRPQLMIVDARPKKDYFGGTKFDYLAFLHADPNFSEPWSGYRQVGSVHGFDIYRRAGCD